MTHQDQKQVILNAKLTTIFTGVCSACAIAILAFIWNLKEDVPKLKQSQEQANKQMDVMQNTINSLSTRLGFYGEEQVRQGEKLNFIQSKIK